MKKIIATVSFLSIAFIAPAHADGMLDMAKQKQCLSCHSVDKDMVGPSFKNIANRFRGLNNAQTMLQEVVMKGSSGATVHWGATKMPPSSARVELAEVEAMMLVQWILATK